MKSDATTTRKQSAIASDFVCSLATAHLDVRCGGKASNLGSMIELGIPVPIGFVITDRAFQAFLEYNELHDLIDGKLKGVEPKQTAAIDSASRFIHERILAATIPQVIVDAIDEMCRLSLRERLVPPFFRGAKDDNKRPHDANMSLAVRSSAIGEDSQNAAFAGQLDSFLNINADDTSKILLAVLNCWASYWSQRSLFYQLSRGISLSGMGVIVQQMVASQISGILFTQNPESSRQEDNRLLAEYCFGLGDELAAGKLNPGRFFISRDDFQWKQVSAPEQNGSASDSLLFCNNQITQLAQAALSLEDHFCCPQDIEWTIDDRGKMYLVQSRPITVTAAGPIGLLVHWSNANVNENFPNPITPFLYSIASAGYYHYFRNLGLALGIDPSRAVAMESRLQSVIGVHGARIYYSLTNIHALLRMAPGGELLSQWFNSFVGADQTPNTNDATAWRSTRRSRFARTGEALRIMCMTTWQYLFLTKRVSAFERTIDEFAATTQPNRLHEKSLPQLLEDLRSFMDIRCNRWTNASLADTAAMVSYGVLKRLLNHEFPSQDQSGLHNSLLKGLGDVVSGAPITALWDLSRMVRDDAALCELISSSDKTSVIAEIRDLPQFARFQQAFEAFLDAWGFRCSGELMLTVPSFQEQPEALLDLLQAYVSCEGESPLELLDRQSMDRVAETAKVLNELQKRKVLSLLPWPSKATLAAIVLKACHKSIGLRERARLKQALLYSRCRRITLAVADILVSQGRLNEQNDVFFLAISELDSLLAGSEMFPYETKELVQLRKRGFEQLSQMNPADAFVLAEGTYLSPHDSSTINNDEVLSGDNRTELTGVGACGGRVTARAAILADVSEFRVLKEGDILVTRQTDPGWGPVFFLVKGLVMERGGMLSHGAILAREYGIPTVVGIRNATERIATGQTICVNGDCGVVQILDQ